MMECCILLILLNIFNDSDGIKNIIKYLCIWIQKYVWKWMGAKYLLHFLSSSLSIDIKHYSFRIFDLYWQIDIHFFKNFLAMRFVILSIYYDN